uniref:Uncharacterized protein n=1 Tax=Nelumbo nucifera TaxID=4432 RepID=A0A822XHN4_NELNU|nr:TPA_asm: hypothetical protein HUJ06_020022 [Nelumbo nucifera]
MCRVHEDCRYIQIYVIGCKRADVGLSQAVVSQICLSQVGSSSVEPPPPPSGLTNNVSEVDIDVDADFGFEYGSDREDDPDFKLECEVEEQLEAKYKVEDADVTKNPDDPIDNVEAVVGSDILSD